MSLALPTQPDDMPRVPPPYLPLVQVVELLSCTPRWAQRLCDERWGPDGLAKKFDGAWGVHPRADTRLRVRVDLAKRDRQQIAEMVREGVKPKHVDLAKAKRDIINSLADYDGDAPTERTRREHYVARLHADGTLEHSGLSKYSVTSLYRDEARYRTGGIRALVRKSTAVTAAEATGQAALDYIRNLIDCGNNISLATAITIARGEAARNHKGDPAWKLGSYSPIRLEINRTRPLLLKVLTNKGERRAKGDCVPKGHRDYEAIPANAEWVGDERTLDVWCRALTARGWKAVRPKITAWMDMRSRVIVGWVVDIYADSNTILASLKIGISKHGKPVLLRVDWGRDYKKATGSPHSRRWKVRSFDGPRIGSVLDELAIEVSPVMPYTPWSKPIESFFKTMKEHLDKLFAAFWGGCPSERHEDRHRYVSQNLEKLCTLDDIRAAIAAFIDVYHRTPHGAVDLFGKSPLEAMGAFRDGPARMESDKVLDLLFREFIGPKLVRRDGIRHNKYWYGLGDSRLVAMQGQKVLLAVQPDDASRATVCALDRAPKFDVECDSLHGFTQRDAADLAKRQARLMRPFKKRASDALRFIRGTSPAELLANRAAGIEAQHGKRVPTEQAPPTLTIRPELEEAIEAAGPAPSDVESVSKAVRTGTDDGILPLDELLDDDPGGAFLPPTGADVADDDGINFEDLTGE